MVDPTCGFGDKLRDLVVDQIWKQILYLICYHENIEQLKTQLLQLTDETTSIQHRIDEARNNGEQIEDGVLHWLDEAEKISKQEEISNTASCSNICLRYTLSKRAKKMSPNVADLCVRGENFDRVSYRVPPQLQPEQSNRESNEGIDSRVMIMNRIMEALRDTSVNMIGLCGPGGVGKTTIAKEVRMKVLNQKMFGKVITATVSSELNVEKIQGQIAEKLGMQLNERFEDTRASRLCQRLKQEKDMLLILDDLWEKLDLDKVGIPFNDGSKTNEGCKILLTSRDNRLLSRIMQCQQIVEVGVLTDYEALKLFQRIAGLPIDTGSQELITTATEIVQKCGGLVLAINTAAKSLRSSKDIDEWKAYLARLNNPLRRNNTIAKEVDDILKLSYDRLNSEYKRIFLLSAMLSHDPSIEDLLMFCVGLDILDGIEDMEEARVGVSDIVSKLKSLNLFLDSSISSRHFTIHDVFRDAALPIASNELQAFIRRRLKEWPDEERLRGCHGVCLQESGISDLPNELLCPELEFFMLNSSNSDLKIPNMFFKYSEKLKVLEITNVIFSSLPSLRFLQKLKALGLHSCSLEDITEVGSLTSLKVLSLAHSKIQQLPIELAKLTSLQMLNLSNCYELKVIPPKLLSSLKKLEVLYMKNSFCEWEDEGSRSQANENASLDELKDSPISSLEIQIPRVSMLSEDMFLDMNLKRHEILIGSDLPWRENYDCKASKILKLDLDGSSHSKRGVRKLLEGVDDLYLRGSDVFENVLQSHEESRFPHLRHLWIQIIEKNFRHGAARKKFQSLFKSEVFMPMLEVLELSSSSIPLIWDDQLSHNTFRNLKTMIVEHCGFEKLVPLHVLKSLNSLEEVTVRDCDMLEVVFDFGDFNEDEEMGSSLLVVVPLKTLNLWNLPKLKNVWRNQNKGIISFQRLSSVCVSYCKRLTSIFPASIAKSMLGDLKELKLRGCYRIDIIVAEDGEDDNDSEILFSKLKLLEFDRLHGLRRFCGHNYTLRSPSLEHVIIRECPRLNMFSAGAIHTPQLQSVQVDGNTLHEDTLMNDLNTTIQNRFTIPEVISTTKSLALNAKNITLITNVYPEVKFLHVESFLDEMVTFPYNALEKFPELSGLLVEHCSFENIFPSKEETTDLNWKISSFKSLVIAYLDKLKSIWKDDSQLLPIHQDLEYLDVESCGNLVKLVPSSSSFGDLRELKVHGCDQLMYLLTSSTVKSLVSLRQLKISDCKNMEEIVMNDTNEDVQQGEITFNNLFSIQFTDMQSLKMFCSQSHTFKFPNLTKIEVVGCPEMKKFCPGVLETPGLYYVKIEEHDMEWTSDMEWASEMGWDMARVSIKDLNKTMEMISSSEKVDSTTERMVLNVENIIAIKEVFLKVSTLYIQSFLDKRAAFPYSSLEKFPNLHWLTVKNCSFEDIFPSKDEIIDFKLKISPLMALYIADLDQLKSIWKDGSQLPLLHQALTLLKVKSCCNLVKLVPSSASFQDLTELYVHGCHQLIYLVTSSTAKSLVSLTWLEISDCKKMEEIVMNDTNEDVQQGEITFSKLHSIEFTDMQNLKIFCSQSHTFKFPELGRLEVVGCPKMKKFCPGVLETPQLSEVKIEEYDMERGNVMEWAKDIEWADGMEWAYVMEWASVKDLNKTMEMISSSEKVDSTTRVMFLNAENITVIKEVFLQVRTLGVESFLDKGATFPYSSLEKFPNLGWLHVEHCSFEDIFPSKDEIIDFKLKISHLTVLDIADLNQLKSIWKDGSQLPLLHQDLTVLRVKSCCNLVKLVPSFASFQDLRDLYVHGCHQVIYLVTSSTAKSLVSLRWLEISDCKKMEEIVMNDTNEDVQQGEITFNNLYSIKFTDMQSLKMFCSQSHTFKFPELIRIEVVGCPEMKKFCPGVLETPQLLEVRIEEHDMGWKAEEDLNKTMEMISSAQDNINT